MGRRTTATLEDADQMIASGFAEYYTDPSGALHSAESALKILERKDDPYRRGQAETLAAFALEFLSRSEEAIERARRAIEIYSAMEKRIEEGNACNAVGVAERSLARYGDAMESFRRALRLFESVDDGGRIAAAHNNIGSIYEMIGDFEKGLEEYLQALAYYREKGNRRNEGIVSGNVGNIYHAMEDFTSAKEWHMKALTIAREVEDRIGEATLRLNICSSLRHLGAWKEAITTLQPALEIVRSIGNRRLEGAILEMTGLLLQKEGETERAISLYREAATILQEVEAEREYSGALLRLGEILLEREPEEGERLLEESLGIMERIGERKGIITLLDLLVYAREKRGDLAGALEAQRRIQTLYGEIKGEEREQGITRLKARFDVAEKERERLEFERRATEQTLLAEERSREINATAMLLIKKNSLLQQIRDDLDEYRGKKEERALTRAFSRIDEGLRSDDDWQRFEETYRLVHHDFITRLSTRFPTLSPTELKVCALLHIDLSNKEIADLLCISLRTIESHRYKIRKKLDLPGSANLAIQIGQRVAEKP